MGEMRDGFSHTMRSGKFKTYTTRLSGKIETYTTRLSGKIETDTSRFIFGISLVKGCDELILRFEQVQKKMDSEDFSQERPLKVERFATISEEEVQELVRDRVPESTRRATDKWLRILQDYLREKGVSCDFASVSSQELAQILAELYPELRQQNGQPYSRSSLLGCRAALQRHLNSLGRTINLFRDRDFQQANNVLDGVLKKMKREGQLKPVLLLHVSV